MLARQYRLPNERAVKRLYAKGRRFVAPTVFVFTVPNQARHPRAAVICGRKVSAKAVVRNRLKRVARSYLEERVRAGALPMADYLVVIRPAAQNHEAVLLADLARMVK